MSLSRFLSHLFETGRVIATPEALQEPDLETDSVLSAAERTAALGLAGSAPLLSLPAARWAASQFHGACTFLVCRDLGEHAIQAFHACKCPELHSPEVDYSVDLVFRYLPDLVGMARAIASGDALVRELLTIAREWPLSSVGIPGASPVSVGSFLVHPGLRQLYVDRILQRADSSRLDDPRVVAAIRDSLGAYASELSPRLAAQLQALETPPAKSPSPHELIDPNL